MIFSGNILISPSGVLCVIDPNPSIDFPFLDVAYNLILGFIYDQSLVFDSHFFHSPFLVGYQIDMDNELDSWRCSILMQSLKMSHFIEYGNLQKRRFEEMMENILKWIK